MSEFNFESSVCTSIEQSKRLLALGLKKETANCCYYYYDGEYLIAFAEDAKYPSDIPAWSLHRLLLLLLDNRCVAYDHISFSIDETDVFTKVINHIEWLIKKGYFNKEYLV